jgi:hypothetical protein
MTPRMGSIKQVFGSVTYEKLAEMVAGSEPLSRPPKTLKLQAIDVAAPGVFQWRLDGENVFQAEADTLDMIKSLKDPGEPLDRILVFPAGGRFFVMDGHHRMDAYRTVNWRKPIPVEVFQGTLEEAHKEALRRNSHNKLSMTKREKSEAAWKLVQEDQCSRREIVLLTTVSPRTVNYMRSTWKTLVEKEGLERAQGYSWARARMDSTGAEERTEDDSWKDRKAQKIVDALLRHKIAGQLLKHADITAVALHKLHDELPRALMYEWAEGKVLEALIAEDGLERDAMEPPDF